MGIQEETASCHSRHLSTFSASSSISVTNIPTLAKALTVFFRCASKWGILLIASRWVSISRWKSLPTPAKVPGTCDKQLQQAGFPGTGVGFNSLCLRDRCSFSTASKGVLVLCKAWHFWAKNWGWTISALPFSSLKFNFKVFLIHFSLNICDLRQPGKVHQARS